MKVSWKEDHFEIDDVTTSLLIKTYQHFFIELQKMEMWYLANPKKRKNNHYRFMVNWLNKAHAVPPGTKVRTYVSQNKEFQENFERAVKEAAPPPKEFYDFLKKGHAGM